MAVKLDNDQEYDLTQAEKVWMYQESLKQDIKILKKYRRKPRMYTLMSYACFLFCSYGSGKNLSDLINENDNANILAFLAITGLAFWNNYNGVEMVKEAHNYTKTLKAIKDYLILYQELVEYSHHNPDYVDKAYIHIEDGYQKIKDLMNDFNEMNGKV